ncbi:MAG: DUF2975 domain-containing protein [Ruminococcaceae bacterium]|nr:DUF2975 domain-containing protein [Oscillospiraceae bacterium]
MDLEKLVFSFEKRCSMEQKTTALCQVIVRICYVLLLGAVIAFPFLMKVPVGSAFHFVMIAGHGKYLIFPFYAVVPAGYIALICLDKIMGNILSDIVFDSRNVKLMNIVTACCLYASAVGLISYIIIAIIYKSIETVILLSMGEAFVALVVRVLRNVMKKAIEIKEDNDLVV